MTFRPLLVLLLVVAGCTAGEPAPIAAPAPPTTVAPTSVHPPLPTPLPPLPPEETGFAMSHAVPPPVAEFFASARHRLYLAARAAGAGGVRRGCDRGAGATGSAVSAQARPGHGAYWAVTLTVRGRPLRHWPACTFYVAHDESRLMEITACPAPVAP